MPKVSVIIPAYNGEKFVGRAIKSVLNQTFDDFEIIVVDDCSKDKTREVVENFIKRNKKISLITLSGNSGGPAKPRNEGIKSAKGEYIFFLDEDDIYLPDNIKRKVDIFESGNDIDVLMSRSWVFDADKKEVVDCVSGLLLNIAVRKGVFDEVGYFSEAQNSTSDAGWFIKYLIFKKSDKKIKEINEPLAVYFRRRGQDSDISTTGVDKFINKMLPLISETEELMEKYSSSYSDYKEVKSILWWECFRLGDYYCMSGDRKEGRRFFIKSFAYKPNVSSMIFYIMSFVPGNCYLILQKFFKFLRNKSVSLLRLPKAVRDFKKSYNGVTGFINSL